MTAAATTNTTARVSEWDTLLVLHDECMHACTRSCSLHAARRAIYPRRCWRFLSGTDTAAQVLLLSLALDVASRDHTAAICQRATASTLPRLARDYIVTVTSCLHAFLSIVLCMVYRTCMCICMMTNPSPRMAPKRVFCFCFSIRASRINIIALAINMDKQSTKKESLQLRSPARIATRYTSGLVVTHCPMCLGES